MSDGLNPSQLTVLCWLFVGIHLIALPPFLWALRRGQFQGKEQAEWTLDDSDVSAAAPAKTPMTPRRARWMIAILLTLGAFMLSSTLITTFIAVHAAAHPATGKCPF